MQERKIRDAVNQHTEGTVFLLKVDARDYQAATVSLFKEAAENDMPVIYVATKRPYVHLADVLKKNHLSQDFIYVVDAITKTITDEGVVNRDNVTFLDSPQNLTNVSTAISLMANKLDSDHALLVIDSLEALLTYNVEQAVSGFLNDLNDRTDTLSLDLVLFKQEQTSEEIGSTLYSIVDKTMLISKEETERIHVLERTQDHALIELSPDIVEALDWDEGDELSFTVKDGRLILKHA